MIWLSLSYPLMYTSFLPTQSGIYSDIHKETKEKLDGIGGSYWLVNLVA